EVLCECPGANWYECVASAVRDASERNTSRVVATNYQRIPRCRCDGDRPLRRAVATRCFGLVYYGDLRVETDACTEEQHHQQESPSHVSSLLFHAHSSAGINSCQRDGWRGLMVIGCAAMEVFLGALKRVGQKEDPEGSP